MNDRDTDHTMHRAMWALMRRLGLPAQHTPNLFYRDDGTLEMQFRHAQDRHLESVVWDAVDAAALLAAARTAHAHEDIQHPALLDLLRPRFEGLFPGDRQEETK